MISNITLFESLPTELQREIGFLLPAGKDLQKVSPKFLENVNDYYWKVKLSSVTNETLPKDSNYRDFYESFVFEKFMKERQWDEELHEKMINNEAFLLRHINIQDKDGYTALMFSARNSGKTKLLLAADADANVTDRSGFSPLMRGINNEECVKLLLAAGANVNPVCMIGTPLEWAVSLANIRVIKILIAAGADVNYKNFYGESLISLAPNSTIRKLLEKP
jgi:ankyrin repeat protein